MKKLMSVFMILLAAIMLNACNTMSGLGKDVQKAGEKIEDTATTK